MKKSPYDFRGKVAFVTSEASGIGRTNTVCPAVILTLLWESNFEKLSAISGKTAAQLIAAWKTQTPLKGVAEASDVAALIAFLASDQSDFITGQEINVCGGFVFTC